MILAGRIIDAGLLLVYAVFVVRGPGLGLLHVLIALDWRLSCVTVVLDWRMFYWLWWGCSMT